MRHTLKWRFSIMNWNMEEEALKMLNLAPVHPMVQLWQAWLLDKAGDRSRS